LFARATTRRIPTNDLIEVYREGNALRLEFSTQESSRTVLPIWVSDRDAAAEIVTLLPTQRSVELDGGDPGSARKYRFDRSLVALLLIGVVAFGAGALTLQRFFAADRAAPRVEINVLPATKPAQAAPETSAQVGMPATTAAAGVDPSIPPTYLLNPIARGEFERFQAESSALRADYSSIRAHPIAEDLEALEARWREVISRIYNAENFEGIEFVAQRELEIAISRSWRYYLSIHAAGLRAGDARLIALAAAHLAFTETLEAQLSQYAP